ncbi:ATP-binding protein [Undibacterium pigrum]|uniref:ATPase family protein associated with various cellular activities (AAA) n=1 Tax=Undibacterium pigrum TaxID=401470 RepID=A0A318JGS9_9BURK|nr:ATP-binding protein [Undibacterium pigrum]PXX46975.1 ATPase family protein associated with various cellular activities (AAA) [Undibacterium pigrum]
MREMDLELFKEELSSLTLRPGLLFGPGVTRVPGELAEAFYDVFARLGFSGILASDASDVDYPAAVDAAFELHPEKHDLLTHALIEKLRGLKPSLEVPHIVLAGWSAYVAMTEDLILEEALRNYTDGVPSSKSVTIVDHASVEPPSRSYPIYKLLGNLNNSEEERTVCLSDADTLLRKQSWSRMMNSLSNYLRDAPLVVLGFESALQRLRDVLSLFATQSSPRITKLRFLKGDPCLKDPTIRAILKKFDVAVVDGSQRDLTELVSKQRSLGSLAITLAPLKTPFRLVQDFASNYDSPVAVVPIAEETTLQLSPLEKPSCIDSLFRPASSDWRPFQANLDLKRDCVSDIANEIRLQVSLARPKQPRVVLLVGDAGVGKTTIAKRVALEVSENGTLVLWCRRVTSGLWLRSFKKWVNELFTELKKSHDKHFKNLILFCDDPWALRIDSADALVALEESPIPTTLVVTLRNTDRYLSELRTATTSTIAHKEIDIPFELSDGEMEQMSEMLLKIGAVTTVEKAMSLVQTAQIKNARDILCSLWYLVPETKSQLAESLKDEYFRLGDVANIPELAQSLVVSGKQAHKAYEYVTVSTRLGIGLPVEVLVHALGIDYAAWIGSLENGRPLWGLLYDDMSDDGTTVMYFTRNDVVTKVLIDLVNGGLAGHMGEVRVLKELIVACKDGSAPYRGFLIDVLVRARHKLGDLFSYEQGYELYEAALDNLPFEDRLLEHHFGIWIQDKGPKDGTAYRQMEKALRSAASSGSDRDAPREHIHASMAAAMLQQVRNGAVEWTMGAETVEHHLSLAASPTFFNAHTSHVAANLRFELAQLAVQRQDGEIADKLTLRAFEEIERAYQTVGAKARTSFQHNKTIGMLEDLQRKILGLIPDSDRLKSMAVELFKRTARQSGFALAARRQLVEASQTGKGKDYNELNSYLRECFALIELGGSKPTTEFLSIRVDLVVRWKIQGFKEVDWDVFCDDLLEVLLDPKFENDVLKRFYLAVAYFHLNNTTEANATFAQLRRENSTNHKPNSIRAIFQDKNGNPRRFQCNARLVGNRAMASVPELQIDAPLKTNASGVIHVFIGFSFNGPVAVLETPEIADIAVY